MPQNLNLKPGEAKPRQAIFSETARRKGKGFARIERQSPFPIMESVLSGAHVECPREAAVSLVHFLNRVGYFYGPRPDAEA